MTHIAADKKEALSTVHTRIDDIRVFTDRSGINNLIGAAAVTYDDDHSWSLSYGLGPISQHTVFEGKLVGVILALELLRTVPATTTTEMIALDNQAAISAMANNAWQLGQYLLDEIHSQLRALRWSHRHLQIHLEWVPGQA